jgi:MFS family permease
LFRRASFYTPNFFLLSASSFLFFASFNMLIPELPGYLTAMGGGDYIGLIISLFTLTAGLSRPFSGKLADTIGRIPVMIFGALVAMVISLMYPLLTTVAGFLFLRLVHGFSTGFTPTGTSAYVADVVPANRRGEALGLHSLFASLGMAAGPALGGYLAFTFDMNTLFIVSSGVALLSILLIIRLPETLQTKQPLRFHLLKLKKNEIIEPSVWVPSTVMFLMVFSFGIVVTIVPDLQQSLGIQNKGLFFAVFTFASISIRFFAGKISDRLGRAPVLVGAAISLTLAMLLTGHATSPLMLLSGAVLFGFSTGMGSPTVAAWTIDLANDQSRGKALATMYIALEAGIGLGAIWSGYIYDRHTGNFGEVFNWGAGFASLALVFLIFRKQIIRRRNLAANL